MLEGLAVRLEQGDFGRVTREAGDPVALTRRFAAARPPYLHAVALDAARDGVVPLELARQLVAAAAPVPLQFGGGVRLPADATALAEAGVARVIVGTAALEQGPERYVEGLGERLVVAVDVDHGAVRTHGWTRGGSSADDLVDRCRTAGVARILCTAVDRDGTLAGPDLGLLEGVVARFGGPVLAAGGIRSHADLAALERIGVEGAVVGRALLDGVLEQS